MLEKSPEQMIERISRAVFFYSCFRYGKKSPTFERSKPSSDM